MSQMSFSDFEYAGKRKQTRRERFLAEMDQVVPWAGLLELIEPFYPKAGGGRKPYPLETMLRIHLLQNWFSLSDPAMEEALYEITPMRQFARLTLSAPIPEDTTIMNFRHLLEKHQLAPAILAVINGYLQEKGLSLRQGTIVDATIIHAPSSTKNKEGKRDPEMHQTKKGGQYFFGMKAHIGADVESGLVHHVHGTAANVADVTQVAELLHGEENAVYADATTHGNPLFCHFSRVLCNDSWTLRLDHCCKVRPLLNAECTNISHRFRKPRASSQRLNGKEQVGHIFVIGDIQATLNAPETIFTKGSTDFGVCLCYPPSGGVFQHQPPPDQMQ